MERARQSDTWTLASQEARPWLLMLWATAWEQTPCGSMPDDDELIAAKIGMPRKTFAKHRAILLRRWWKAEDGRLYHDVLVLRATEMVEARSKTAQRVAKYKALRDAQRDTNALPTGELPMENDTGTGTGTGSKDYGAKAPASLAGEVRPEVAVCIALRQAGVADTNASHPKLIALVAAGAVPAEFVSFVNASRRAGVSDGFAYVMKAVEESRKRAKAMSEQIHHGALPEAMTPGQAAAHARVMAVSPRLAARKTEQPKEIFDVTARIVG